MQIHCSFTSFVLADRYDHQTALTRHRKLAQKKHTLPHRRTLLGGVVNKGYILRYLATYNSTTTGFCVAFQFRGLMSSTTY